MRAHIGALVEEELVLHAEDLSVLVDRGADAVPLLARVVGGDQMLAPVLDPFYRPAEFERRGTNKNILGIDLAAHAEAAADMALVKLHRVARAAEHAGKRVAVAVRHLGGAMELQHIARGVMAGDGAARLERHARMAADRELELDHAHTPRESRRDIAVGFLLDGGLDAVRRVEHRGQRLVRHRDEPAASSAR